MKNSSSKKTQAPSPNKNQHYIFVLKEGKLIQENCLDYSLMLLQVTHTEFIPSPDRPQGSMPIFYLDRQ